MQSQLIFGLAVIIACSGCEKKAEGQSVAVVNNEEITASELNAELTSANIPAGMDQKAARAKVLQVLIERRLLTQEARKEKIDQSPEFINRQRRMNDELLIGIFVTRQMDTVKLPTDADIVAFEAKQPQAFAEREVWKLGQLQYQTPKDPAIATKILQTKTIDQLAGLLTSSGIQFQRGNTQLVTSAIPADMYPRLAGLPPGEPFIVPNGAKSIASSIISREPAALADVPARTEAVSMIRRQSATQTLQQHLKDLKKSAKIEYKDGFAPPK